MRLMGDANSKDRTRIRIGVEGSFCPYAKLRLRSARTTTQERSRAQEFVLHRLVETEHFPQERDRLGSLRKQSAQIRLRDQSQGTY